METSIPKHKEIIEALLKINKSEFLTIDGIIQTNQIDLSKIELCQIIGKNKKIQSSVNQTMSPKGKLYDHFFTPNYELENRANRYNVKNKRVTLNNNITKDEVDEHLNAVLSDKRARMNKEKITNNGKEKKLFYNKWFLPVKFWKIPKKAQKTTLMEGNFFYNLHQINPKCFRCRIFL